MPVKTGWNVLTDGLLQKFSSVMCFLWGNKHFPWRLRNIKTKTSYFKICNIHQILHHFLLAKIKPSVIRDGLIKGYDDSEQCICLTLRFLQVEETQHITQARQLPTVKATEYSVIVSVFDSSAPQTWWNTCMSITQREITSSRKQLNKAENKEKYVISCAGWPFMWNSQSLTTYCAAKVTFYLQIGINSFIFKTLGQCCSRVKCM